MFVATGALPWFEFDTRMDGGTIRMRAGLMTAMYTYMLAVDSKKIPCEPERRSIWSPFFL